MTDFLATGDCNNTVTLTQTKGSSFPFNLYTAAGQEFSTPVDTVTLPHGTPTVAIHADYRNEADGPVVYSQDFTREITWQTNCATTTTPAPPTTTTVPATTVPGETTTTVLVPTTHPSSNTLPATGAGSDFAAGVGLVMVITGILAVLGGAITRKRVHH